MRVLVVGGAGHVGSIIRPALVAEHDYHCFDLKRVDEIGDRSIVGDINDQEAVKRAVDGIEGIIYLPMRGMSATEDLVTAPKDSWSVRASFDTHVQGFYRFLCEGLASGAGHFVYASTLNVYSPFWGRGRLDESTPPEGFACYAITKRLGEHLCLAAAQYAPQASIVALRLAFPVNEKQLAERLKRGHRSGWIPLRPNDVRRLFLAAITCPTPGGHIVQATGDLEGQQYPNARATELLGWKPEGN